MIRTIAVTGSEGFIGRWVVQALLRDPALSVIRVIRPGSAVEPLSRCRVVEADVLAPGAHSALEDTNTDALIHLAWDGLSDFRSPRHLDQVDQHLEFLTAAMARGIEKVVCVGTCLEYGLVEGELDESMTPRPIIAYATAKAALGARFAALADTHGVDWAWGRLFYPYGPGQHARSLWTSLHDAIARGDSTFPMSPGAQVRDYLAAEEVGSVLARLAAHEVGGQVLNISSGRPVVLRDLVERWVSAARSSIRLDFGAFEYPAYEPMSFWGSRARLEGVLTRISPERKQEAE